MSKQIILIISLFAICHSQEFDYSKMSETEKILVYSEMKKSPVLAGFLEIIPTAGYAYSGNWKRGFKINDGKIRSLLISLLNKTTLSVLLSLNHI